AAEFGAVRYSPLAARGLFSLAWFAGVDAAGAQGWRGPFDAVLALVYVMAAQVRSLARHQVASASRRWFVHGGAAISLALCFTGSPDELWWRLAAALAVIAVAYWWLVLTRDEPELPWLALSSRAGGAAAGVAAVSARRGLVPRRHRHPDRLRGAPAEQRALRPRRHRPRGGARGVVCARAHRGRAVVCGRDHGRGSAGSLPVAVRARTRGARGGPARRRRRPCRGHRPAVRTVVRSLPGRARARARAAGGLRRRRRDRRPGDRERVCRPGVGRRLRRPGSEDALPEPLGVERRGGGGEHRIGHAHRDGRQQRPRRRRHRSARLRAAGLH